jgi:tetratricopeptide (TPR) repeat protein
MSLLFFGPRTARLGRALAATLLACLAHGASGESTAADPRHAAAFSASAAELLAIASSSAPAEEAAAIILLNERRYTFNSRGRRTVTDRMIYRVLDSSAVDDWSSVEVDWAPWIEETPSVRARVVTPDGKEHLLDPKTIAEEGVNEGSRLLYGNRHHLRAPLPAITAGAVVEQEIITREKEPLFDAGLVSTFVLNRDVPVDSTRMELEAPRDFELATVVHVTPSIMPRKEELGDRVRLTWEVGRREPTTNWEPSAPSDSPQSSYIAFATGHSWNQVAHRYAEIVDGQLRAAELKAAVSEAVGTTKDRTDTIARLLAWIQKRIRYTGVEFSEATIIPRSPAETLKRGYGDCKDKAALLVAALRQAGIPAFVALLRTGPGPDVEKSLYGLGWFDHAIVFVPGSPDVWIDPTETLARAGQIPNSSQDRLALVARKETTELVRIPAAVPSDNVRSETREFFLAERGSARVVETTESTGAAEISYRHSYADASHKQSQETVEEYARVEYLAKGPTKYTHSDPADLTKPFTLRIEAEDAGRGTSQTDQAVVAVLPSSIAQTFPPEFQGYNEAAEEPTAQPSSRRPKPRTLDYVFFEPFVAEWRYRIHPPVGFRSASLPDSKEEQLGAASLTRRFSLEADGTVGAVFKLDVGKRRLTAERFEATREAVSKLAKKEPIFIRFEQIGHGHLAAGRVKEALVEFRGLAVLHPQEALHRTQIATALLEGGMGDAAREMARKATALDPKSALSWRTLGWVMQHDSLGRRFRAGFSRDEAIAAYRKSRELDFSDVVTRADLAILLEHDAEGVRYGRRADLAGAIEEYRALRKDLKNHAFDINLCLALMRAERFPELADAARELDPSPTHDQFLILAAAAKSGSAGALSEASRLVSEAGKRREALETVARTLIQLRRYPEAAALLSSVVSGSPNASALRAQADTVAKAKKFEEVALDESDPKSFGPRLIATLFIEPHLDRAKLTRFFASSIVQEELDTERTPLAAFRILRATLSPTIEGPLDFIVDLALPAMRQDIEGDADSGYRVRLTGSAGMGATSQVFFLVQEGGSFRFLAEAKDVAPLGREALARLEAGHSAAARRLLDWAREELPAGSADDPLGGPVFSSLWTKGKDADAERIRLAAAALAVGRPGAKHETEVLMRSRLSARTDLERAACDRALAGAYALAKDYDKALPLVERLTEVYPDSASAFRLRTLILIGLRRFADVRKGAQARLDRLTDDPDALRTLFREASVEGDYANVEKWGRRLTSLPSARAEDYNSLAWNALFGEGPTERAIEDGRRAVDLTKQANAACLHTLATLYAEVGKTTEARQLILRSLDVAGRDVPRDHDWYVFGRIAENYGERAAAIAAYGKVKKPANEFELPESTFLLASRRLKALGANRPEKSKS